MMLRIYTASKLRHAEKWKELQLQWSHVDFTARWFQHHVGFVPDTASFAKMFWLEDEEDVKCSDLVIVYAEPDDKLRGALVEAGIAIAWGIPVLLVGPEDHPDFGTWQYHPLVYKVSTLYYAHIFIKMMEHAKWLTDSRDGAGEYKEDDR